MTIDPTTVGYKVGMTLYDKARNPYSLDARSSVDQPDLVRKMLTKLAAWPDCDWDFTADSDGAVTEIP